MLYSTAYIIPKYNTMHLVKIELKKKKSKIDIEQSKTRVIYYVLCVWYTYT